MPTTLRSALVTGGLAFLVLVFPTAAWAHTSATGSEPADGQTLRREPRTVSVSFTEPPLPTGAAMVAVGPQGRVPLAPNPRGSAMAAPWPSGAPNGTYTVNYRVVAADGHPITGQFSFRLDAPGSRSTPSAPAQASEPAASAATQPAAEPQQNAIPVWLWLLGAALIAAGAYLAIARGRKTD